MKNAQVEELTRLVNTELLPVYIKYHETLGLPVPKQVINSPAIQSCAQPKPVAALLRPIKNST
jgi:hypothetical protein